MFACSRCGSALELERVISAKAERRHDAVTGYVVFQHHCDCTPAAVRATRALATHQALVSLFGSTPWLPYDAPFRFEAVGDDDPLMARWRWEIGQVADGAEFLLFLDDAQRS